MLACDLSRICVQALPTGLDPCLILRVLTVTWNPIPPHCLLANQYPCGCLMQPDSLPSNALSKVESHGSEGMGRKEVKKGRKEIWMSVTKLATASQKI